MITPAVELGTAPLFRKEFALDAGHGPVASAEPARSAASASTRPGSTAGPSATTCSAPAGAPTSGGCATAPTTSPTCSRTTTVLTVVGRATAGTADASASWAAARSTATGSASSPSSRSPSRTVTASGSSPTSRGPSGVGRRSPTTCTTGRPSTPGSALARTGSPRAPTASGSLSRSGPLEFDTSRLEPYVGPPVTPPGGASSPVKIWRSPSGRTLVDFGQNLVGWVRFTVRGPAGSEIRIRHAEVLEHERAGRPAAARRPGHRPVHPQRRRGRFEPTMTFHGFRYAEVTGWPGELDRRRSSRRSSCTPTCAAPASSSAPTRCSTSSTRTSSGARRATSSTCPPTARSATSGSAGPATSPSSRPSAAYLFDVEAFLADWLRRPRPRAGRTPTGWCRSWSPTCSSYARTPAEFPEPGQHRDLERRRGLGAVGAVAGVRRPRGPASGSTTR